MTPSPPSTRPSGSRARRSSAFVREYRRGAFPRRYRNYTYRLFGTFRPSSCTGQLTAKVPTARMFTLEARQATSCAAAPIDCGGTLSTIIEGGRCDSPPDIFAPRQFSATEALLSAPWGEG